MRHMDRLVLVQKAWQQLVGLDRVSVIGNYKELEARWSIALPCLVSQRKNVCKHSRTGVLSCFGFDDI